MLRFIGHQIHWTCSLKWIAWIPEFINILLSKSVDNFHFSLFWNIQRPFTPHRVYKDAIIYTCTSRDLDENKKLSDFYWSQTTGGLVQTCPSLMLTQFPTMYIEFLNLLHFLSAPRQSCNKRHCSTIQSNNVYLGKTNFIYRKIGHPKLKTIRGWWWKKIATLNVTWDQRNIDLKPHFIDRKPFVRFSDY